MRNEIEKFHHTIGVLVKAYIQGTLQHTNGCACAVGNMVAEAQGKKYMRSHFGDDLKWECDSQAYWMDGVCIGDANTGGHFFKEAKEQAESTGYTLQEIAKIEFAFEYDCPGEEVDEDGYMGLMRVVNVLADIHGIDLSTREETKKLFVKEN